jgi:hypothetical protein
MIPPNGVWVRASYPGSYIGEIGLDGSWKKVNGSGDNFYPISTNNGLVAANFQKQDGTGDRLLLEIYKNGVIVKQGSTITPKGIVEISLDLKTLPAAS